MLYGIEDISRDLLYLPNISDKLRGDEFWAVDDVSFEVKRGECLGIIGRNGEEHLIKNAQRYHFAGQRQSNDLR
jgi:ABC-type antimicrobial peptide transport system ATPase subunit